ncbi:MAG: gamma-glutamyltransferase, partial [Actinomycetota bacterium]
GAAIAARVAAAGGFLTAADVAGHAGAWVEPLRASFRGLEVLELPPPTQGMTALGALRILDGLDLGPDGPDRQHLLIEALRIALADRARVLGDPDAMTVTPASLLTDDAVAARRAMIDPGRAAVHPAAPAPDGGTVYLCAADRDGLMVSLIQSNFFAAGSGLRVDEWGINLHNRGSGFVLDAGHPNVIGPRKLPMHTLIPALALRDGQPGFVFGTEGAHGQAQTHAQLLTRIAVDGSDPQAAISAPRFTIDPGSGVVVIEDHMDAAWIDELERRGHEIRRAPGYRHGPGIAHLIERTAHGVRAASDPRAEGGVAGG